MYKVGLKLVLIFIGFFCSLANAGSYLQDRFHNARPGAYIVTAQENTYSLLLLRSLSAEILVLEEITVPSQQINLKTIQWRTWLAQNAPGHTSWTLYEIDLEKGQLIECFSQSKNGWIYFDAQEQFFAKLFTLPFTSVPETQRKKIGPAPALEEVDHRKCWNPPLIIEGKKIVHPLFEVIRTRWPEDSSVLAACAIDLYFDAEHTSFPFPYWIEVQSPHYAFKVRTIESGHDLLSPIATEIPRRPPELTGLTQKGNTFWTLPLNAPLYHTTFRLSALDLASQKSIPVPHRFERQSGKEEGALHISTDDLKEALESTHRYQWVIYSDKTPTIQVRSEETFAWK